jgi:hypothetical protein
MNDQHSESGRSLALPMTAAEYGNTRLDFDETFFSGRQMEPAEKKKTGERLPMSTA